MRALLTLGPLLPAEPRRMVDWLHIGLDRAVLHAYGWDDIEVPPYTPAPRPSALPLRPSRTPSSTVSSPSTPRAPPGEER